MASHYSDMEIEGMDYLVFLGADAQDNAPSQAFCQAYADQNGIDPAKMLIDPDFATLFANLDSGQAGGIGLPWDGVVDGSGMVYVYNPSVDSNPLTEVQKLLDQ